VTHRILLVGVMAGAAVLLHCGSEGLPKSSAGQDGRSVLAEFVYQRTSEKAFVTVRTDSIIIERRDKNNILLSLVRRAVGDSVRPQFDSLLVALDRVQPGIYRKALVPEGTQIRVRFRGEEVFCDNCLNDFILEHAGAPALNQSGDVRAFRDAVGHLSELMITAEGQRLKPRTWMTVTLDKDKMKDPKRSYEVKPDTTTH
jgi:hypothetical protein